MLLAEPPSSPHNNPHIRLIPMTRPSRELRINYNFYVSGYGKVLIADTGTGICFLAPVSEAKTALGSLRKLYPSAQFTCGFTAQHAAVLTNLQLPNPLSISVSLPLPVHIPGTAWQFTVWRQLLQIPYGTTVSYTELAIKSGKAQGARAVGSAVGKNPAAIIIPCHRVINKNGSLGGYRWGLALKKRLLAAEKTN